MGVFRVQDREEKMLSHRHTADKMADSHFIPVEGSS